MHLFKCLSTVLAPPFPLLLHASLDGIIFIAHASGRGKSALSNDAGKKAQLRRSLSRSQMCRRRQLSQMPEKEVYLLILLLDATPTQKFVKDSCEEEDEARTQNIRLGRHERGGKGKVGQRVILYYTPSKSPAQSKVQLVIGHALFLVWIYCQARRKNKDDGKKATA